MNPLYTTKAKALIHGRTLLEAENIDDTTTALDVTI